MTTATTLALLAAVALLVERLTSLYAARRAARLGKVEPAQAVANAAATVASSVESILAPLQEEVASLRRATAALQAEVHALRECLAEHGIPAPRGPFLMVADEFDVPPL